MIKASWAYLLQCVVMHPVALLSNFNICRFVLRVGARRIVGVLRRILRHIVSEGFAEVILSDLQVMLGRHEVTTPRYLYQGE